MAQRLVRILCEECKEIDTSPEIEKYIPNPNKIYKAKGCPKCNFLGYSKRVAVGELFIMNDEIKQLIATGTNDIELRKAMIKNGMKTLKESIIELLNSGKTSLSEAIRVGLKE